MAEYYSVELSQKINRGMQINASKFLSNGSNPGLGYKVDKDRRFYVDEQEAIIVREIFQRYARKARICVSCRPGCLRFSLANCFSSSFFSASRCSSRFVIRSTDCPFSKAIQRFSIASSVSLIAVFSFFMERYSPPAWQAAITSSAMIRIRSGVSRSAHTFATCASIRSLETIFLSHFFVLHHCNSSSDISYPAYRYHHILS